MKALVKSLALALSLTLCQIPAGAQSWDAVRALRPGDRVRIREAGGAERNGTVAAVTADAISLDGGKVSIDRAQVKRLELRRPSRRARNAAIGAGVGLAVGIVADSTLGTYLRNEVGEGGAGQAITYVAPIALFAALGAAIAPYRTIYKGK